MDDRESVWTELLRGGDGAEQARRTLGFSQEQAGLLIEFHEASRSILKEELDARLARRASVRASVFALVLIAGAALLWPAAPAWAQAACLQTLPAPLSTLCAGEPARASAVNSNFQQLHDWLAQKTGPVGNSDISTATVTATGSVTATGTVTAGGMSTAGNISAGGSITGSSLSATGMKTIAVAPDSAGWQPYNGFNDTFADCGNKPVTAVRIRRSPVSNQEVMEVKCSP